MGTEIEHKYLVNKKLWKLVVPHKSIEIRQAYLSTDPDKTIRIRIKDNKKGCITIKGKQIEASREEYEYVIPLRDARELIKKYNEFLIIKTRHIVIYKNKKWEVDEFKGLNRGLIVAELELRSEDEKYTKPKWTAKQVTNDKKYANANLAVNPFSSW